MAEIRTGYSDYVRYVLQASTSVNSHTMYKEPIGWSDDDLEFSRHKTYHGIFFTFTNNLKFTGEAKSYIKTAFDTGGINTKLYLRKEITRDLEEVKWTIRYVAIADYNTMFIKSNILSIKFNSNDLAELIKSHESDDYEIETDESIDGLPLDILQLNKTSLAGRDLYFVGESKTAETESLRLFSDATRIFRVTPRTEIVSQGMERHSPVTRYSGEDIAADRIFYNFNAQTDPEHVLRVRYDFDFYGGSSTSNAMSIVLMKLNYNTGTGEYDLESQESLFTSTETKQHRVIGYSDFIMSQYDALLIYIESYNWELTINKWQLVLTTNTFQEASQNLDFIFTYDLIDRLMYIITGRKNAFYSKILGRTNVLDSLGKPKYAENGSAGLIGVISGLWARGFIKGTKNYKSLTISLKDVLESIIALLNVGIGIETVGFEEQLRVEDLKYFYRNEVIIKLPFQITDQERIVDKDLFFSAISIGYEKGADYEDGVGLDEPNGKTDWVSPIRKSVKKYIKYSKIRGDETELELTRRKTQFDNPNEDTKGDSHSWWLDLKETNGTSYVQNEYYDRLEELPTGILSPESWRGFYFTPLRMFLRHAWIFRAGLEPYLDKYIRYISSKSNSELGTRYLGEDTPLYENDDVLVSSVERSRFVPWKVKFVHPVDDDLMDLIMGTTRVVINGKEEEVPNYYFKFEWINEDGKAEGGYLDNLKPNKRGEWEMQKANENLI